MFLSVDYFNLSSETLRTNKQQLQKCISYFKIQIPNLNNYEININHTKFKGLTAYQYALKLYNDTKDSRYQKIADIIKNSK